MKQSIHTPHLIRKGTRGLLLMMLLFTGSVLSLHAQNQKDSVIVYNESRPLIYEDAWDLWPYVFLNENGDPDGYNIDLLKMICKELRIPYIVVLKPTLEAQADLKNGRSDLMFRMDASYTKGVAGFGKTIIQLFTHSIVTPKSKSLSIRTVRDLTNREVIVHTGSFSENYLKKYHITNQIEGSDDMSEIIQRVSANDEGIILWNTMSLKWLMHKYQTDNLQLSPIEMPYGEYKFFSRDENLLAKMDSVYSKLKAEERLTGIQNKWFYPERKETGIPDWIWYVITILGIIVGSTILMSVYHKIRERQITKSLLKKNARLNLIMQTSHVSFWTYDVATETFTTVDKNGMPDKRYTSLEFSQRYSPEDNIKLRQALNDVISERKESVMLHLLVREMDYKDTPRDFNLKLSVLTRNHNNKPTVIICSRNDITEDLERHRNAVNTMLRYQSVFNSALVDMVYYDAQGYIQQINNKCEKAVGLSSEEVRARRVSIRDVLGMPDFDIDQMETIYLTQLFHSKSDKRPLRRMLRRDELYYELLLTPVRDKDNRLLGIYGTGHNITEIVYSYRQIKENTRQLQQANDAVTTYINNIDYALNIGRIRLARYRPDDHTLTIFNEVSKPLYDLTQSRLFNLLDNGSKKTALRLLTRMDERQDHPIQEEMRTSIRLKNGVCLFVQVNFIPVYENGSIKEYFGMIRDISEIKALEEKLAHETVKAQEVELVKNAFLHNMCHEIRTPLTTIVGFSELFEEEHDQTDENVFIQQIKSSSDSLLILINNILFLSRLEAGMIAITPRQVDLAQIFEGRCDTIWKKMQKSGVNYIARSPYEQLVVEVDDTNLFVIMEKVLTNACQYTRRGTVLARYEHIGNQLIVSVEDTGIGIPESLIDRIFERFVTGDNGGAGLGLSICHELIERMGGDIQINSKEGSGTIVWFSLPCKTIEMKRKRL